MTASAVFAVALGAVLGAWSRWALGTWLNGALRHLPLGTLVANALGGYLVGLVLAWLMQHPEASPAVRLFVVTGFLGALTTFSTFSAEAVELFMRGEYGWALAHIGLHLGCTLALTVAGFQTVRLLTHAV